MTSCFRKQPSDAQCKGIKDSGSHAVDFGFKHLSVELGFWIQTLVGFRIPQAKFSRILESGFHYMGRFNASFKNIFIN